MTLQTYGLDRLAQKLVLVHRSKDDSEPTYRNKDVLNEGYKMRTTVSYGLERFWGEYLRLGAETHEGQYWKDVWDTLVEDLLKPASITLPNETVIITPPPQGRKERSEDKTARETENTRQIHNMVNQLWEFAQSRPKDQRIALAILMQLCDCIVWWTQRYK
jgi:hypothetical protein